MTSSLKTIICAVLVTALALTDFTSLAQSPITPADLSVPSKIAPDYFGPNAFPIPDMLDGTTSETLKINLAGDYFLGRRKDHTGDIFAKLIIPLFTDRVNLSIWMQVAEFYHTSPEWRKHCRLPEVVSDKFSGSRNKEVSSRGYDFGDAYVSTDIRVLKQTKYIPDLTVRAALKSASGGSYYKARFYDCPGYFFDATIAKSIRFDGWDESGRSRADGGTNSFDSTRIRSSSFVRELRFAASGGFLCWQTDNGRQDDAVMFGAMIALDTKAFCFDLCYGGYLGWEKDGDRPMSIKTSVKGHIGNFAPYISCQIGIADYPYTQFRIGLEYNIRIL